ncbi:MAG: PD-(D/E)XK nuclease family protein [Candidatus Ancillula sp.]|jgi:superfamily I DNA/RNA helicase|nr:PD-(D/E)XK nuclease family protein [Candidatus Ancillula sp.]
MKKLESLANEILSSSCNYEVFGSACSGKTSLALSIMLQAKNLRKSNGVDMRVTAICSSRINASNLKKEYLSKIVENNVQLVEKTIDIRTIHSLCSKIFLEYANYTKYHQKHDKYCEYELLTGPEEYTVITQAINNVIEKVANSTLQLHKITPRIAGTERFVQELRELIETAENLNISPENLNQLGEKYNVEIWKDVKYFYSEYIELLDAKKKIDHVRTIFNANEILKINQIDLALDILVVDDAEELSYSALNLIKTLMDNGTRIVLIGCPNETAHNFRGSIVNFQNALNAEHEVKRIILDDEYAVNLAPAQAIEQHLNKFKSAKSTNTSKSLYVNSFENLDLQIQYTIYEIRRNILNLFKEGNGKVDYNKFAIIAHSASILQEAKLKLELNKIPTNSAIHQIAIRSHAIWKSFTGIINAAQDELNSMDDGENINEYAIKNHHKDVEQCFFVTLNQKTPIKMASDKLIKITMDALKNEYTISRVFWNIWNASNVAKILSAQAINLSDSNAYNAINTAIQIFHYAKEYENKIDNNIYNFMQYYNEHRFSADNLYANSHINGVNLLTPASAKGKHFDYVFILELNDSWPNLKPHDLLLKYTSLFDIELGIFNSIEDKNSAVSRIDSQKEILNSELRAFYVAITRTSQNLYIFSTLSEDSEPSSFFQNAECFANKSSDISNFTTSKFEALDLQTLIYKMRLELIDFAYKNQNISVTRLSKHSSAMILKKLFNMQIANTKTSNWYYANEISNVDPVFNDTTNNDCITISPSSVETLLKCPLKWFFEKSGCNKPSIEAKIGTIVHETLSKVNKLHCSKNKTLEMLLGVLNTLIEEKNLKAEFDNKFEEYTKINKMKKMMEIATEYYYDAHLNESAIAKINDEELNEAKFEYKLLIKNSNNVYLRFLGRIDRVEKNNKDELLVIDWKTGENVWTTSNISQKKRNIGLNENPQLLIYQMLLKYGSYLSSDENTIDQEKKKVDEEILGGKLIYLGKNTKSLKSREYIQRSINELAPDIDIMLDSIWSALNSNIFETYEESDNFCNLCSIKYACIKSDAGKMIGHNVLESAVKNEGEANV